MPTTRKVNNKALSSNITLTGSDILADDDFNGKYKFNMKYELFYGSSSGGWVQVTYTYPTAFSTGTSCLLISNAGTLAGNDCIRVISTTKTGFTVGIQRTTTLPQTSGIYFFYLAIGL